MRSDTIDEALPSGGRLQGHCAPAFSGVLDEFRTNYAERGEVGASVCIVHEGAKVVDLWGGIADPATGTPWESDTIGIIFSGTKGVAALIANLLVERGKLHLYDDVAKLWPEFARNGKAGTTLAMMLSHCSPVPALRDPIRPGGAGDWDYMIERMADERAWWAPGTRQGYHAFTYAWTVGQMVRVAAGKPLAKVLEEEITGPHGIDFWIGLPEEQEHRVAPLTMAEFSEADKATRFVQALYDPETLTSRFANTGGLDINTREGRAIELCSGNGITNARGLASIYSLVANHEGALLGEDTIIRMSRATGATHEDAMMLRPTRFGLGFMLTMTDPSTGRGLVIGDRAFGHVGAGGSVGFADPQAGMSFAYTMNKCGPIGLLNDRGQSLVDAAYRSLGWKGKPAGAWRP
jgi:CubicO group peptidase (beta-lactamase class C family)